MVTACIPAPCPIATLYDGYFIPVLRSICLVVIGLLGPRVASVELTLLQRPITVLVIPTRRFLFTLFTIRSVICFCCLALLFSVTKPVFGAPCQPFCTMFSVLP